MKTYFFALLIGLCTIGVQAQQTKRQQQFNLENGIAIQGYDAVSYFSGKPTKGKSAFAHNYQGVVYYFATAANRETFKKSPEKYEPAYGGWCSYAMGDSGEKVEIDPQTYKIVDGKLNLFYNKFFTNTLPKWNKDESNLKRKADASWKKFFN
ncbi:MAG: YHS domain protein [Verrucomicrobia bacterium]|nr:YHS domain protein [Cytophagales bacterium]